MSAFRSAPARGLLPAGAGRWNAHFFSRWLCSTLRQDCCWACPAGAARCPGTAPAPPPAGRPQAACPGGKLLFQGGAVGFAAQHRAASIRGQRPGLGPKDQASHPAAARPHPGPGKGLGPRRRRRARQGKHRSAPQVSATCTRTPPAAAAARPLGQPAAHGHRHPLRPQRPACASCHAVAVVEGVVLRNDACKASWNCSFSPKRLLKIISGYTEKMAYVFSGFVGRVYKKPGYVFEPLFARVAP